MFGRRRSTGGRHRDGAVRAGSVPAEADLDLTEEAVAGEPAGDAAPVRPGGPWDAAEPHPDIPRVDLGSVQVPVSEGTDIQLVFTEQQGAWVNVRHGMSELQIQAFAAPKRESMWDEIRAEAAAEISGAGGQIGEAQGPFGPELVAQLPVPPQPGQPAGAFTPVRFAGIDGPRWFLRAVFAGAAAVDPAAAAPLEAVLRDIVVVRGDHPVPPRELLELRLPPEAQAALEEQARQQAEAQGMPFPPAQPGGQGESPDRFTTQPNPFDRGPEFTETR